MDDIGRGGEVLKRIDLFHDLDDDEIAALLLLGQMKSYASGATIFVELAAPDHVGNSQLDASQPG